LGRYKLRENEGIKCFWKELLEVLEGQDRMVKDSCVLSRIQSWNVPQGLTNLYTLKKYTSLKNTWYL
jgi:hypothetical protein